MANAPAISSMIDVRSSGILMDYVHSHEPCAPGAAAHARRRMFQYNSLLSQRQNKGGEVKNEILKRDGQKRGCCASGTPYNGSGSIFTNGRYGSKVCRDPPSKNNFTNMRVPIEEEEDYSKFDRVRDWVACFGAVVIVACIIGLIHSFAVFAPAIQNHYGTGLVETVLLGCLSYFALLITIPLAVCLNDFLENRWTAIFGMIIFFLGLLMDALTFHVITLYISHIVFMGFGGACAYVAAMCIVSDHFRRHLMYALCAITCAGSLGTIIFYVLSNLMLSYVSYMWTKLCLALIVLVCTGACQTFPKRTQKHPRNKDVTKNSKLKDCVKEAAKDRETKLVSDPNDSPRKSCLCICVCDISVWTDISFLLWAVISFIAIMTMFIPYLFLVAYAYTVGTDYAVGLVCWFCVASILARLATMNSNDHTFGFNRTVFQVCCIGSGILYIFLNWAETYGWILVWGLAIGAIEGIICVVIPRVTLQCIPLKWLSSSWRCIGLIHSFSVIVGPMIMMSVYYNTYEYGPALIAIGVAQIIAGILAFLLPNEEANELEDLEDLEKKKMEDNPNYYYPKMRGPGLIYYDTHSTSPPVFCGDVRPYKSNLSTYGDGLCPPRPFGGGYATTGGGYRNIGRYSGTGCGFGNNYDSGLAKGSYRRSTFDSASFLRGGGLSGLDTFSRPYTDECPICSKVGCIPGCCECTPGDLNKSFLLTPTTALVTNRYTASFVSSAFGKYDQPGTRPQTISMEEVEQFISKFNNNRTATTTSNFNHPTNTTYATSQPTSTTTNSITNNKRITDTNSSKVNK